MTIDERSIDAATADRVEAMAVEAERLDGVAPLGEQPLRALRSPSASVRHFLVAAPGAGTPSAADEAAGYAQLTGSGDGATAELVVHPRHRRRGLGTALVRAVLEAEPGVAVWAHGDLPAARALADGLGLARTRELLMMRRRAADGPALPDPRPAEGIETGTLADAASEGGRRWPGLDARAEFLRVNNAAFSWHPEQGGWSREQLDERLAVDWVDPAAVFLAVDVTGPQPTLAGFHWTKTVAEAGEPVEGEVYVVAVDPAEQGRGLGGLLTAMGVAHLEGTVGAESVVLYVEGDNTPAIRTYERLGFVVEHRDVTYASR
ncbi:mycothiol synthase [Dietzia massiliensis]|uniref:mycothiol synthase n=1 Tax=Dietzia massiliensis TaxID=2697499 RepID=UPI001BCF04E5|nr:mycothiol synthase [Dietzia massiliensis]MBS7548496.1 mycothiol synthase [Dietzia massiliensis]